MSRLWSFYSYNPARFTSYFDGSVTDAASHVFEATAWEDGVWRDPAVPARLAAQVTIGGISYDELPPADATVLDQMLPMLFAPEGLAEQWEVVPESPDGLHPSVIRELLPRAGRAVLLPVLLGGRRIGAVEPSECGYCLLTPAECERLAAEAEQVLASGRPWSQEWVPDVVDECLIGPLRAAVSKGRPLFGLLG